MARLWWRALGGKALGVVEVIYLDDLIQAPLRHSLNLVLEEIPLVGIGLQRRGLDEDCAAFGDMTAEKRCIDEVAILGSR